MNTGEALDLPVVVPVYNEIDNVVPLAERTTGESKYGTWDRAFSGLRDALAVRWMQDHRMKWKLRD